MRSGSGGETRPTKAAGSKPRSASPDLEGLGGDEVFNPAGGDTGAGRPGGGGLKAVDPRVLWGVVAGVVLVGGFGAYEVFHNPAPTIQVATNPGVLPGPAALPPPPVAPADPTPAAPPPPPLAPTTSPDHAVALPGWYGLRPVAPVLPPEKINDAMVAASIGRGVGFLKPMIGAGYDTFAAPEQGTRATAGILFTYALLHAGQAVEDADLSPSGGLMAAALERVKAAGTAPVDTYGTSLRAQALALAGRDADRAQLGKDQQWLVRAALEGAYSYTVLPPDRIYDWDGSNSQYGVLGVWASSEAGLPAPARYWQDVERHWLTNQRPDGGWSYRANNPSSTPMTAAGVATLCVAAEQEVLIDAGKEPPRAARDPAGQGSSGGTAGGGTRANRGSARTGKPAPPVALPPVGRTALADGIDRGLAWLGTGDSLLQPGDDQGYTLYGIERAALATGYRYFGAHDWYRELGAEQLRLQGPDGSWAGPYHPGVETAFRLLFLARGRQPLLMDKLRFKGNWNDRPRDLAKLTAYVSQQLERPFAWGVADLDRDWWDWLDAPIIYISTDAPPAFTDDDVRKLRAYSDAGGFILLHDEFADRDVDAFATALAGRVWPEYPMAAVAASDLLYRTVFTMGSGKRPPSPLKVVTNGTRPLMVYSPTDVSRDWVSWKARDAKTNPNLEVGLNLFVAAAGKSDFRNRLNTPYLNPSTVAAVGTVPVQQLTYAGGRCDPEPGAWVRFGRWLLDQSSVALDVRPTDIKAVNLRAGPVAVLTGNQAVDFTQVDVHALTAFVSGGGTLLIDAAGGDKGFARSVREQLLPAAFGGASAEGMPLSHPILAGTGPCMTPLPKPRLRKFVAEQLGLAKPPGVAYLTFGSGTVLVSDLDVTTALLHSGTYGIYGYTPDYADGLYKNAILWTLSRFQPAPTTGPTTTAAGAK